MKSLGVLSRFALRRWPLVAASGILALSLVLCTRPPVEDKGSLSSTPTPTPASSTPADSQVPPPTSTPPLVRISGTSTEQVLVVSSALVPVNQTASLDVLLTTAPQGISGFDLTVEVADKEVGEVVAVDLADFGLTDKGILVEGQGMRLRAADIQDIIPPGAPETRLATLQIRGKKPGITLVRLSLTAMDDDKGDPVTPHIAWGQLQVTASP